MAYFKIFSGHAQAITVVMIHNYVVKVMFLLLFSNYLALTTHWENSADDKLMILLLIFPRK